MQAANRTSPQDRPLKVMFLLTSMPIGGAEMLLMNLVRGLDRSRFQPEVACLKQRGPLGEELADEIPVHTSLLGHKYDFRVLPRLCWLFRRRKIDAVVTIGAGDKMFWGRIAARISGVPVVVAALHSTGWPDSVGRLNRWLTRWTDAFVGVATSHVRHLIQNEQFPRYKVHLIPNGVDTERFHPGRETDIRQELRIASNTPVIGILAALRPEKNHDLFLRGAKQILAEVPETSFLIVGDGPCRGQLERLSEELGIRAVTHFLGSRSDVPEVLRSCTLVALTSHNEASPVSILEALSTEVPVVAANVGSVHESVIENKTGKLFPAGDLSTYVQATVDLLKDRQQRQMLGQNGRHLVLENSSLAAMVDGYQTLLERLYAQKTRPVSRRIPTASRRTTETNPV